MLISVRGLIGFELSRCWEKVQMFVLLVGGVLSEAGALTGTWAAACWSPAGSGSGWSWSRRSPAGPPASLQSRGGPASRAPPPPRPPPLLHPVRSSACSGWPPRDWWRRRPALGSDWLAGCQWGSEAAGQGLGGRGQQGQRWLEVTGSRLPPKLHGWRETFKLEGQAATEREGFRVDTHYCM